MNTKKLTTVLTLIIITSLSVWGISFSQKVTTVQGKVCDAANDSPLRNVKVHVEDIENISDVLTNNDGKYFITILDRTEAKITFSLEDYTPITMLVRLIENNVVLDVRLSATKVLIEMTEFRSQEYIKGRVQGLNASEYNNYKIVAYVLTDMWYLHPEAKNEKRKGFAIIDSTTGNWELNTIWRGNQAFKLALMLIPKTVFTPATIPLDSKTPENALLGAISCEHYCIIDPAPKGI